MKTKKTFQSSKRIKAQINLLLEILIKNVLFEEKRRKKEECYCNVAKKKGMVCHKNDMPQPSSFSMSSNNDNFKGILR
jgi:hypothetical protein